jgi:hypothetical protein
MLHCPHAGCVRQSEEANRPPRPCSGWYRLRLILGFGVVTWRSGDQGPNERGEQLLASLAGVVNKLEEPEVDLKLFL